MARLFTSGYVAGVPLRVEWVEDAAGWDALAAPWQALAAQAPAPFSDHQWFDAWWRAFGDGGLATCTVWDGADLAGVFPLARRGGSLAGLINTETPSFRPLARDDAALGELCAAVLSGSRRLELAALPRFEPPLAALNDAARRTGRLEVVQPQYFSPVTDTTGGFEAYRARMKSRWRELERRARKTAREHEVELRCIEVADDVAAALEGGLALEASGWKGESGTAILSSPQIVAFYRDFAERAHARGELRVSTLHVDGALAAFDLALLHGGRYHLLKTAYDEGLRNLGPGLTLRRAVVERCFELGLEAHEFLGANMPWKQLFAEHARPHVRYRAYARGPLGTVRWVYHRRLVPTAKRMLGRAAPSTSLPAPPGG